MLKIKILTTRFFLPIFATFISLIALLIYFGSFDASAFSTFFSSDCLTLPSIFKDLFIDGHPINGWNLNPAPNFFPDMGFYFLLMAITKSVPVSSFLFSIIQFFAIVWLFYKCSIYIKKENQTIILSLALLIFPLFLYVRFHFGFYFSFLILTNSYHNGAFVLTLLSLLISFKYLVQTRPMYLFWLFVIGVLAIVSDKLFVFYFIIPFSIALIIAYALNRNFKHIKLLIICFLAGAIGLLITYFLQNNALFLIEKPILELSIPHVISSWNIFYHQFANYLFSFSVMQLIVIFSIISYLISIYHTVAGIRVVLHKTESVSTFLLYQLFIVLAIPLILAMPILSGCYFGEDIIRYFVIVFVLLLFNLAIYLSHWNRLSIGVAGILILIHLGIATSMVLNHNIYHGLKRYFTYCPTEIKYIESMVKKHHLKYGVANYWLAKKMTQFSKKDLRIYAVFDNDLTAFHHAANQNWFYGLTKGKYREPVFNFFLCSYPNETPEYIKKMKIPHTRIKEYGLEILTFDDFRYDRNTFKPIFSNATK